MSSVWDAQLKRTRKVSGKVLGKITQEKGFIKRESYCQPAISLPVLSKEYGATVLFQELILDSILQLERLFPESTCVEDTQAPWSLKPILRHRNTHKFNQYIRS